MTIYTIARVDNEVYIYYDGGMKKKALQELKKAVILAGSAKNLGIELGICKSAMHLYVSGKRTLPIKHYITIIEKYPQISRENLKGALQKDILKLI